MIMRKELVTSYLFSFAVGFVFSELLDVHELWINVLPSSLAWSSIFHNKLRAYLHRNSAVKTAVSCPLSLRTCSPSWRIQQNSLSQNKDRLLMLPAFTIGKGIGIAGNIIDKQFLFQKALCQKAASFNGGCDECERCKLAYLQKPAFKVACDAAEALV